MDLRELEKYRPIPWGGARLLAWVASTLLIALGCAYLATKIPGYPLNFWGALMLSCAATFAVSFSRQRREVLRDYWRRNVRGYLFWCGRDSQGKMQWGIKWTTLGDLAIGLPLGGWFRRRGQIKTVVHLVHERLVGWSLRRCVEGEAFELVYRHRDDKVEERISVSAESALHYLEIVASGELRHLGLSGLVSYLDKTRDVAQSERDEAKKRVGELKSELGVNTHWLDEALAALDRAIVAIDATRRFKHHPSKEAQRIREEMIADLLRIAPLGHPLRERYEKYDGQRQAS